MVANCFPSSPLLQIKKTFTEDDSTENQNNSTEEDSKNMLNYLQYNDSIWFDMSITVLLFLSLSAGCVLWTTISALFLTEEEIHNGKEER